MTPSPLRETRLRNSSAKDFNGMPGLIELSYTLNMAQEGQAKATPHSCANMGIKLLDHL